MHVIYIYIYIYIYIQTVIMVSELVTFCTQHIFIYVFNFNIIIERNLYELAT